MADGNDDGDEDTLGNKEGTADGSGGTVIVVVDNVTAVWDRARPVRLEPGKKVILVFERRIPST